MCGFVTVYTILDGKSAWIFNIKGGFLQRTDVRLHKVQSKKLIFNFLIFILEIEIKLLNLLKKDNIFWTYTNKNGRLNNGLSLN